MKDQALRRCDIGIVGDKIQFIEQANKFDYTSKKKIDATGLYFLPGFIDTHSHTDEAALNKEFNSKVMQGVVLEICGNCGGSPIPINSKQTYNIRKNVKFCEDGWYPQHLSWSTFYEYSRVANQEKLTCNHLYFVGLWTLYDNSKSEQDLLFLLSNALESGCVGLSINQGHKSWINLSVKIKQKIFEILQYYNKIFSVHLADYGKYFIENINEIFNFIKQYRVRVVFSHMKFFHSEAHNNYKHFQNIFNQICSYTSAKFDLYPYDSICTRLSWILNYSSEQLYNIPYIKILKNGNIIELKNGILTSKDRCYLENLLSTNDLLITAPGINQSNMFELLMNKHSFIGSDYSSFKVCKQSLKTNHERGYRTFFKSFKLLMTQTKGNLENVISKLSFKPCMFYNIKNRGKILENYYADILICKINNVHDLCLKYVLINGKIVYKKDDSPLTKYGYIL